MLSFLLLGDPRPGLARSSRFYRVEISDNLFGEYSVLREWGACGCNGRQMLVWFSNLRDACLAADGWRARAERRGYRPRQAPAAAGAQGRSGPGLS